VRIRIDEPAHDLVDGVETAIVTIDRFGFAFTIPHIQSSPDLAVRATLVSEACPDHLRWILAGGDRTSHVDMPVVCGEAEHAAHGVIAGVPRGEYKLIAEARASDETVMPLADASVAELDRVAIGDIYIVLGESTSEGYGTELWDGSLPVAMDVGAFQASAAFAMDRWDRVPDGTASIDRRTYPQIAATSLGTEASGCGAPSALACPVGTYKAGGPPTSGAIFFSGYGASLADALAKRLGYPVFLLNLAYGGHTTAALLRYPGWGLDHPAVASQLDAIRPNRALIVTGINDAYCVARCGGDSACEALCGTGDANYEDLVSWAGERVGGTEHVFLADPTYYPPEPAQSWSLDQAAAWAKDVRLATGARLGPELSALFLHRADLLTDGIHPNAVGYRLMADVWGDKIELAGPQTVPHLSYLPLRVPAQSASGIIAVTAATPFSAVTYSFFDPVSSLTYGPTTLACGLTAAQSADAFGACSYAYGPVALSPAGTWTGNVVDASGASATAKLVAEP
jgi:lysophospholipase L1-like esterase